MSGIGGFFELELPRAGEPYHAQALALSSGRACLRTILECLKPARVWAPFYICDAVLPAIAHAGAALEFYGIDDALEPVLPPGQPAGRDVVMVVNYFGLKTNVASSFAARHGRRTVIDDTQAFFQRGYQGASSFNSARKFFGVPDGGYAYGAVADGRLAYPPATPRYDHLVTRWTGDQARAFQQYQENEALVTDDPAGMSALSTRLLAGIDYAAVRRAREQNFFALDGRLGARNRLRLDAAAADGPFCYPLLVDQPVPWDELWRREIYVPRLWADLDARAGCERFGWERELASRLLPLPIDHRYGASDMDRVAAAVVEVMGW